MGDRRAIRNSSLELKLRQVFFLSDRWWLILDRLWSHMLITKYIFLLDPFANNVMMNFEWCNDTWESRYVWYSRINYSLFFVILICIQTQYTIIKHPQRSVVSNFWKFIKSVKCQCVSLARAKATKNQSPRIIHHLKRTIKVLSTSQYYSSSKETKAMFIIQNVVMSTSIYVSHLETFARVQQHPFKSENYLFTLVTDHNRTHILTHSTQINHPVINTLRILQLS